MKTYKLMIDLTKQRNKTFGKDNDEVISQMATFVWHALLWTALTLSVIVYNIYK